MLEHHPVIRWIVVILGGLLIYVGALLKFRYDLEKQQIISYWQQQWVEYDTYQEQSLTKQAAFMKVVLSTSLKTLDVLFGTKLLSLRFVSSSIALSYIGMLPILLYLSTRNYDFVFAAKHEEITSAGIGLIIISVSLLVIILPIIVPETWSSAKSDLAQFSIIPFLIGMMALYGGTIDFGNFNSLIWFVIGAPAGSIVCDVMFISLTRKLIAWSLDHASVVAMNATVGLYSLITVAIIGIPLVCCVNFKFRADIWFSIAIANLVEGLFLTLLITITILMTFHRVLLPTINRLIYSAVNCKTDEGSRKVEDVGKQFIAAGCLLIGLCGWKDVTDLVSKLLGGV